MGINTASVEKQQKFKETLNALTSLQCAADQLKSLTNTLCGDPPEGKSLDPGADVGNLADLLSDTPRRIGHIVDEINACTDRLNSELN